MRKKKVKRCQLCNRKFETNRHYEICKSCCDTKVRSNNVQNAITKHMEKIRHMAGKKVSCCCS